MTFSGYSAKVHTAMLTELYTYLTTSCPQYVRHMDYLYEIIAMRGRSLRNRVAWQPHLDKSRNFILKSAGKCRQKNRVVVLGAGLLLDVPLQELSSMFREVVLADIVILPEVRRAVKRYPNVKLMQHDVTGMAQELYERVQRGVHGLPKSTPGLPIMNGEADLVVSLNILSQLWVMPRAYALKKLRGLSEEQVDDWCGQIVSAHYDMLRIQACAVCLVADHAFVKQDRTGAVINEGSSLYGHDLPVPEMSWDWDVEPIGEGSRFASKKLHVGAWHFEKG